MERFAGRDRLNRLSLILNSFIFIISAYLFFSDGKLLYAGIIFFTGLFYLIALRLMSFSKTVTDLCLYILNMIVALVTALDFFSRGTRYIQYAWLSVTAVYLVFFLRQVMIWQRSGSLEKQEAEIKKNN